MYFKPSRVLLHLLLGLSFAPLSACQSVEPSSASERASGTLHLPLIASSNGHQYRLRSATFAIEGPTSLVLDVEQTPDAAVLSAPLVVGSYEMTLQGDWFLERLDASGPVRVDATLLGAKRVQFEIDASTTRSVTFSFTIAGHTLSFDEGTLAIGVDVTEITDPAPGLKQAAGQLGGYGFADGVAALARLSWPSRLANDGQGHLFLTDGGAVRRFDIASRELITVIGADGFVTADDTSDYCGSDGIAVGSDGNVYIADGCAIYGFSPATQVLTVLAGSPNSSGGADGTGISARFGRIVGLAADALGNLYAADASNSEIRKIALANAEVSTLAGALNKGFDQDGSAADAAFAALQDVALGVDGTLLVAEGSAVRQVRTDSGEVTTLADAATLDPEFGGQLASVASVAGDESGNVYVTSGRQLVQKIAIGSGELTTLAGNDSEWSPKDGVGEQAVFYLPSGFARDGGSLYVASDYAIRRIDLASREVVTVAGAMAHFDPSDDLGERTTFGYPWGMTADGRGNVYTANPDSRTIHRIKLATGEITKFAGRFDPNSGSDGPRLFASLLDPTDVTCDADGNLYVADSGGSAIRKIDVLTGEVSTLAGTFGTWGFVDGVGASAMFNIPAAVESDGYDTVYIVDSGNLAIRKLSIATREVTTVVGPEAGLPYLAGLTSDGEGSLYTLEDHGGTVFKIDIATGTAQILAGSAEQGYADGVGSEARFGQLTDLACDHAGNLYVVDSWNNRLIRKIEIATATVTTVVGTPGAPSGVLLGTLPGRLNSLYGITMLPGGSIAFTAEQALLTARF